MKLKIKYDQINEKYINAATELVLSSYNEERIEVPILPGKQEFLSDVQKGIENLFKNGTGIVALCDNELIGFLSGFHLDELFGKCKGIYSPLYGHGVKKEYRSSVYKELYKRAAKMWVKESYMSHAITFFTHDKETIDTWFWLGFGLRCVDAIREVGPVGVNNKKIMIQKAKEDNIPNIAKITVKTEEHLNQTPMFMPFKNKEPIKYLSEWLKVENHHLWVAYREGKPVGYMKIQPNGESFISEHKSVMNITGAYVEESERNSGIGAMLLEKMQQWLLENGYPLCGVDFESFNTVGSSFWTKYFIPYTYSMVRRIDERIKES